ncbi:MAG: YceI family protein [Bacteroidetes bacterium]|nr:YceI family protein [Bacteroidota bacterium]
MKAKNIFLIAAILFGSTVLKAQIYLGKTCDISFFSSGPIEDISAINKTAKPIFNAATGEVAIKVTIKGFTFDKKLMEEHFNEKYMESDKYPYATFKGKVNEQIDYKKDGTYKATVTGKLDMHGVVQERTIEGTVTIKGGEISFESKFNVALKDHNITIPTLIAQNVAEIVQVTIKCTLTEYKK